MTILGRPKPLGFGQAAQEAHSIAAPMLTAAALALAGVVAGADPTFFLWPGPTLLVLVAASLSLVASMQLHYHARHYYYSPQDIEAWYGPDAHRSKQYPALRVTQRLHFEIWERYIFWAILSFNAGTSLLGLGVSLALAPSDAGPQAAWRWVAFAMVLLCTALDVLWIAHLYRLRNREEQDEETIPESREG
ncbi:hypothetical protein PV350_45670 [Streptomyces sp. PA03-6a]|nr:hypothetical protein [Streptomyces sp. PA03-6a]